MKLIQFLFGKKPDIFNKNGKVEHQRKKNVWKDWKNRYINGKEYDWKKHSGIRYTKDDPPSSRQ